jgi:signal transduction histidine kinase
VLLARHRQPTSAETLLAGLARTFDASAAGLANLVQELPASPRRVDSAGREAPPQPWPWEQQPGLPEKARDVATAIPLRVAGGPSLLVAHLRLEDDSARLLWVEDEEQRAWSADEAAALWLAGQVLAHLPPLADDGTTQDPRLGRQQWQQRLCDAAVVSGKLAHDFGNVLTGILGFAELALAHLPASSPAHRYVNEVYQAAQQGLGLTQQMQTFGQRNPHRVQPTALAPLLAGEQARLGPGLPSGVTLQVNVPADLPPVAMDAEALRQVLDALVQNAREALGGRGSITIAARRHDLTAEECLDLVGKPVPGPCIEVSVADTGCGLSPEVRERLFNEPFFTTKVRRRGWGLALVHGILRAHGGGFRMDPRPGGGTFVRLFVPQMLYPPSRPR